MSPRLGDNYYSLLRVDPKATVSEIVAAYHAAKNAFAKDSIATYSLFNAEDTQSILAQLEEAYLTLSNIEKRREYDRHLVIHHGHSARSHRPETAAPAPTPAPHPVASPAPTAPPESTPTTSGEASPAGAPVSIAAQLRDTRIRRALSIEDVGRITKIPVRCIQAIEDADTKRLPARVYLQGFLKNLVVLYHLNPEIVGAYLAQIASPAPKD